MTAHKQEGTHPFHPTRAAETPDLYGEHRPMFVVTSAPPFPPFGNLPWAEGEPNISPPYAMNPPSPASWGVSEVPLIPGPIMQRWST